MSRLLPAYALLISILTAPLLAQTNRDDTLADAHDLVGCGDSPTPGKRPANMNCATLVRKQFSSLPKGPRVLRLETFRTIDSAERAASPISAVIEAVQKIWLVTLGSKGERSPEGTFVAEIGPIPPIPRAASYEFFVGEADFGPEMKAAVARAVHTHPGPEIFYVFTGEQCLETPSGVKRARAGEGMIAPAETPMQLNIMGSSKRDGLFVIIHDSTKPTVSPSDWQPKGICGRLDAAR
jgi:hypothetical protein